MNFKQRKGIALGSAPGAILSLVLIALVAVVGQKIATQLIATPSSTGSGAVNSTIGNVSAGIAEVTSQLTLVGLIIIMAIVIGLLFSAFRFGSGGGGV